MDDEKGTNNNAFLNVSRNEKWVILQFAMRGAVILTEIWRRR
jgi:hypothetical protein